MQRLTLQGESRLGKLQELCLPAWDPFAGAKGMQAWGCILNKRLLKIGDLQLVPVLKNNIISSERGRVHLQRSFQLIRGESGCH